MNEEPEVEDSQGALLSAEELETQLKASPNDLELRVELAYALVSRYLGGEVEHPGGDEADIEGARALVARLPENRALFPRAYLAFHDENDRELTDWSLKWVSDIARKDEVPYDCDDLWCTFVCPFATVPAGLWEK